jgi:hypothetical protein
MFPFFRIFFKSYQQDINNALLIILLVSALLIPAAKHPPPDPTAHRAKEYGSAMKWQ